jgi:uridine phosphorylase
MRDEIVYPVKGKKDPAVGSVVVMVAMETDLAFVRRAMEIAGKSVCKIFSSRLYKGQCYHEDVAVVGPMMGAPYAVMVLEKLIVLGAQRVLFFGWCGSIQPEVGIGDFVIPNRGVSEEGTSLHYPGHDSHPRPSAIVVKAIEESLLRHAVSFQRGAVWSTDAPYRETKEKVLLFQQQGVLGVEMEVSALFTVARFRQVKIGALLVVSDELGSLSWKPGFKTHRLKQSREIAAEVLRSTCQKLTGC